MIRTIVIATALVLATTVISDAATNNKILSNTAHAKYRKDRQTAFEIKDFFAKEKFVRSKPHVNVVKEGLWVRDALDRSPTQGERPMFGPVGGLLAQRFGGNF